MIPGVQRLKEFRDSVEGRADPKRSFEVVHRIDVQERGGRVRLNYYGDPFDEIYHEFVELVASPEVAPRVEVLSFGGWDQGMNGTRNWDLSGLTRGEAAYPSLLSLSVEQSKPYDHNQTIIGEDYDEEGQLARVLERAPSLIELTVPSAPSPEFFKIGSRPLRVLSVDACYDTHEFILNFSRSDCFPELHTLEFGEFAETCLEDWRSRCTPIEHYREMFRSRSFAGVSLFVWRNPAMPAEEVRAIHALRPDLRLITVRTVDARPAEP